MSQLPIFYVALLMIAAIHLSEQTPLKLDTTDPSVEKEYAPINIIRIKQLDSDSEKDHDYYLRKQKSTKKGSGSDGPASSVIVIKPILAPVTKFRGKTNSKKTWKRMVRRPKFLHDVKMHDNSSMTRVARVHLAPGAYPVYYGLAKTNGSFSRIKSITHVTD